MRHTREILLAILLLSYGRVFGQILNDSSVSIYGPSTCNYTYFDNIKYNRSVYFRPDTTINNFQKYTYTGILDNKIQDLGNIGSSAKPVFYTPPEIIGRTSGYYTYQYFALPINRIKLFNTKSPYTDVYTVLGGKYRYILDVTFSQSIKPNWNFGVSFRKLTINKQYSSTGRGDNQVLSTSYDAYMYYWTHDSSYFVMGAFTHMFHKANESGGIDSTGFKSLNEYFSQNNINVYLENANDAFLKNESLIYQQYSLSPILTVYNDFRHNIEADYFSDNNLNTEGSYFNTILFNKDTTSEYGKYFEYFNESGIKGTFFHKAFYNAYFRFRNLKFQEKYIAQPYKYTETYLGGNLRYDLDTAHFLMFRGELMKNGNHLLGADYENRLWKLSYRRVMYSPNFLEENYFGNNFEWHNRFLPVQSDNASALLKFHIRKSYIMPEISFSLVKNYICFGTNQAPEQISGFAQLISPGIKYNLSFGKGFHWLGEGVYTLKTGNSDAADAFRIPPIFVNSELYFQSLMFNSNLNFIGGIDAHYSSAYFAEAYNPVIQQFYLQNNFEIPGYWTGNAYINLGIGNVRIFLKMTYFNEKKTSGYFVTPGYIGQQKVFDAGVNWKFYD